jgi:transcriptional regulator with XRE-family HTH domain
MLKPPESRPLFPAAAGSSHRRSRLQIIREAAGLSRVVLAKRADLSHSTVYLLEDGLVSDFYVSTLMKIATALDVTPNQLLGIK